MGNWTPGMRARDSWEPPPPGISPYILAISQLLACHKKNEKQQEDKEEGLGASRTPALFDEGIRAQHNMRDRLS
jgi:hypothetical protein